MSSDRDSTAQGPVLNSAYYRERFGSQSPEEYKSLRITNMDPKISGDELRQALEKIFSRYGDLTVKLVRQTDVYERIAYVNFDYPEDARDARRRAGPKLMSLLGRKVRVDPANVLRDQGGRMLTRPQTGGQGQGQGGGYDGYRRSRSPPNHPDRLRRDGYGGPRIIDHRKQGGRGSPPPQMGGGGGGYRRGGSPMGGGGPGHPRPSFSYSGEGSENEDEFATRTLFVGNLEIDITINELRRFFDRFGTVEEIDVKTPQDAVTAYAFVRFSDILSAREARKQSSGDFLRDNRCKIGWGKPIVTRRLWVGGLGPDTSLAWLEKEFDRYGAIEKIDFVRGDNHAYILFANQEAAMEAWKKLKGIHMKNGILQNIFQVDYADCTMYDNPQQNDRNGGPRERYRRRESFSPGGGAKRRRSPSESPERRHRSPPPRSSIGAATRSLGARRNGEKDLGRKNDSSPPAKLTGLAAAAEFGAETLDELSQLRSPIWTGVLVLKRSAYPLQLYKMAGDDDLVDAYLRNERGESVHLNVTQRLKLDQPRTGEILRVSASAMDHSAYLLAVPNPNVRDDVRLADMQSKHLTLLVKYFKEKEAAGVVNTTLAPVNDKQLPATGVVYAFPTCTYADDFVATLCPKLTVWQRANDQCLLLVLQKGQT